MPRVLVIPGLGGSGPAHWQSLWEAADSSLRRVEQDDWDHPEPDAWALRLEAAVAAAPSGVLLVAHSLACVLVARWAAAGSVGKVGGALLVAPADVDSDRHTPPETRAFAPVPLSPLPFPSILVASADDPYCAAERARLFARSWGARLVEAGALGHINADSGLGDWPEGRRLLGELEAG
ncbi:MAG: alpha/beta hydrolase [Alphaproteobacteria bacterium]|nr:alpha/beta hydrolase [Alphaproteobacteria bacterium]